MPVERQSPPTVTPGCTRRRLMPARAGADLRALLPERDQLPPSEPIDKNDDRHESPAANATYFGNAAARCPTSALRILDELSAAIGTCRLKEPMQRVHPSTIARRPRVVLDELQPQPAFSASAGSLYRAEHAKNSDKSSSEIRGTHLIQYKETGACLHNDCSIRTASKTPAVKAGVLESPASLRANVEGDMRVAHRLRAAERCYPISVRSAVLRESGHEKLRRVMGVSGHPQRPEGFGAPYFLMTLPSPFTISGRNAIARRVNEPPSAPVEISVKRPGYVVNIGVDCAWLRRQVLGSMLSRIAERLELRGSPTASAHVNTEAVDVSGVSH
ncbi:unnamed protein product, partial [Mesorhabditis spiculigera]